MPEERKPAPLPPLPWKVQPDPWCSRTLVVDAEGCVLAEVVGTDEEAVILGNLFCRAPALEAELKQAFEDHQEVCAAVINLRARLESTEAARRDAQESRFTLIIQNEELGADLAATRARLESAEAALRFYANPDNWFPGVGINRGAPCSVEADEGKRARTALATANDGNTG